MCRQVLESSAAGSSGDILDEEVPSASSSSSSLASKTSRRNRGGPPEQEIPLKDLPKVPHLLWHSLSLDSTTSPMCYLSAHESYVHAQSCNAVPPLRLMGMRMACHSSPPVELAQS
jgi:hypothetical protein